MEAGGFDDTNPPTGTDTANHMAGLEIAKNMRRECRTRAGRLGGGDGGKEDEDEDEEG